MREDSRFEYELQMLRNKERLFKCCQSQGVRCGMISIERSAVTCCLISVDVLFLVVIIQ